VPPTTGTARTRPLFVAPAVAAVVGYAAFTTRNAVDVVHWDAWANVPFLHELKNGTLGLGDLWAPQTVNRMLLPRAIDLAVGSWFGLDLRLEIVAGLVLLLVAALLIMLTQRELEARPLYLYAPVAVFLCSTAQWQNTLWSFQIAWFLVLAALAGAAYAVSRADAWPGWLAVAIVLACAASVCLLQGLLIWPAIALLIWSQGGSRRRLGLWAGAAVVTTAVYFIGLTVGGNGDLRYVLTHPRASGRFFLILLGSFSRASRNDGRLSALLGVLMLALAVWVLVRFWCSQQRPADAFPAALVLFVLLADAATLIGRIRGGTPLALASRYTTFNLLLFVAAYLAMVDDHPWRIRDEWRPRMRAGAVAVGGVLTTVLVVASLTTARREGEQFAADRRHAAGLLRSYETVSSAEIQRYLCPVQCDGLVEREAPFLEARRLSVFRGRD
jgi:hypothetical protein